MLTSMEQHQKLSFLLDGVPFEQHDPKVSVQKDGNQVRTTYEFEGGLRLTNTFCYYPEYDACDWVNEWENTGDAPSGVISELYDCDVELVFPPCEPKTTGRAYLPRSENVIKLHAPRGSDWSENEFTCDVDRLLGNHYLYWFETVGAKKCYFAVGGRSSDGVRAPFFHVKHGNENVGYIAAIGWTGEWKADWERTERGVILKSQVKDAKFRMLPGEKFRTTSVTLMSYRGTAQEGQNKWRRLVKDVYAPIGKGGVSNTAPFCAGLWGGMSSAGCVERIRTVEREDLPFDHYWMDAGWYGDGVKASPDEYEGDWAQHTGNWEINAVRHPDGLQDVVSEIAKGDKRFLLWFEPERVRRDVPLAMEHPEYLIFLDEKNQNTLLDLGNEQAWQYCYDTLCGIIEKLNVSVYRQDFNFSPLPY
ncbi:MAG: alpha-galactosidase [Clostridia bacterium]|nr:alpha-galactosidase [Clostridia bacterium]